MAAGAVFADAEHGDGLLFECSPLVAEITGFFGTTRGVVLGIEVDHHPLALELGKLHRRSVLVWQGEIRGGIADLQGH